MKAYPFNPNGHGIFNYIAFENEAENMNALQ